MRFTKMQGAGNDYIYVDAFQESLPRDLPRLARAMSDRHYGIGGDGLIVIAPSERADARMIMFNADGGEAEMCGNGIRCVAKYLYDHGLARKAHLAVETKAGVLALELFTSAGVVDRVRVDMGRPRLAPAEVPTTLPGSPQYKDGAAVAVPLTVGEKTLSVTCVSMGNPHCVTYVDELNDDLVLGLGPLVERHPAFPRRVNAEFAQVVSPHEIRLRVWERGSGETLACGTGASAVCVAGALIGKTQRKIVAHLPGGDLELEWADDDHVFMTGPAVEVFSGDWPPDGFDG